MLPNSMSPASKPSVSIRRYIKWGDAPPSEPTSTIVLTSPLRHFVDIRLLLPLPLPSLPITDPSRLDWAFAGTSTHNPHSTPPHSVFLHWLDSRHADAASVRDEGDVFPGAVPGEDLERGEMVNPATGAMEAYEECWVDGTPKGRDTDGDDDGGGIGSGSGSGSGSGGWVLRYESEGGRGMMVRIGGLVQGVARIGGELGVVRWRVKFTGEEGTGGTRRAVKEVLAGIGNVDCFPNVVEEGGDTARAGWKCIETW